MCDPAQKRQLGLGKDGNAGVPATGRGVHVMKWQERRGMPNIAQEWKEGKVFWMFKLEDVSNQFMSNPRVEKMKKDDWARLQTGRNTSICSHRKVDDSRSVPGEFFIVMEDLVCEDLMSSFQ